MTPFKRVYDDPGRGISSDPSLHVPPDSLAQGSNLLESKRNQRMFGG